MSTSGLLKVISKSLDWYGVIVTLNGRVADKLETASNIAVIYEAGHIQTTSILEIAYICLKIPGSLGAALAG